MDEQIQTPSFTLDRARYLRTMFVYNMRWVVGCDLVLLAVALIVAAFVPDPFLPFCFAGAFAAVLAVGLSIRYYQARRNVYGSESSNVFDDPRTVTVSAAGVHILTQGGVESQVPWTHFVRTMRRGGFTFLYMSKVSHFAVPDSAFASPIDLAAFLNLVDEHVPSKRRCMTRASS